MQKLGLATKKYTFTQADAGGTGNSNSFVEQAKSPFMLIPAIVVQSGGDPWNIYARLGLVIPVSTKITQDEVDTYPATSTAALEVDDFTAKIKNSFSLGYAAAAGVSYKLNDKVSIWAEVSLLSLSAYVKEADLTAISVNGQNYPLSGYTGTTTIKYGKNVAADSVLQPTYSQPFSNVGINVGICFRLGENKHPSHRGRKNDNDLIDNSKPYRRH